MEKYLLNLKDIESNYFHFTQKNNLKSIKKSGLIPRKGSHAKYIEKTEKVFFVEGLDNLLILFDCWINVYYYMPKISFIYTLGSHFLRQKWFPQFIADVYFGVLKKTKIHKERAFKVFDQMLNESVLLKLDLKENIDFKYNDIDEIKSRNYRKRHLELMGYSKKYSSLDSNEMDKWNLHCLSDHNISSNKIKLCYINNSVQLRDIFNYIIDNTKLDLKDVCPVLYDYINNRKILYKELQNEKTFTD